MELVAGEPLRALMLEGALPVRRLMQIGVQIAEGLGKKVVTEGRSIKNNLEIAQKTGLLKTDKGTLITAQEMADYPPDKIVILLDGRAGRGIRRAHAHRDQAAQAHHAQRARHYRALLFGHPGQRAQRAEAEGQPLPPGSDAHPLPLERRALHRPRQTPANSSG